MSCVSGPKVGAATVLECYIVLRAENPLVYRIIFNLTLPKVIAAQKFAIVMATFENLMHLTKS